MINTAIKLYEIESLDNTRRFQSQLMIGRQACDFIYKNGEMYVWVGRGDWIVYDKDYEIVSNLN